MYRTCLPATLQFDVVRQETFLTVQQFLRWHMELFSLASADGHFSAIVFIKSYS